MIIDKNYEGLKRLDNGDYVLNCIETDEDLIIELDDRLIVNHYIEAGGYIKAEVSIKAGGYIKAGDYIKAGSYIEAGGYIKAGGYIEAGDGINAILHITTKSWISAGLRIFAGTCNWRDITEEDMTITCTELRSGEIAYGKLNIVEEVKEILKAEAEKELQEKYNCKVRIV